MEIKLTFKVLLISNRKQIQVRCQFYYHEHGAQCWFSLACPLHSVEMNQISEDIAKFPLERGTTLKKDARLDVTEVRFRVLYAAKVEHGPEEKNLKSN